MDTRNILVVSTLIGVIATFPTSSRAKDVCTKIVPVVQTIDVYATSKGDLPVRRIEQPNFPDVCSLTTESGRHKVRLQGKFVWVPTIEFQGPAEQLQPLPRRVPKGIPAAPVAEVPLKGRTFIVRGQPPAPTAGGGATSRAAERPPVRALEARPPLGQAF
jgi:hypothetical protein